MEVNWRSIETAPRDGTLILLATRSGYIFIAPWPMGEELTATEIKELVKNGLWPDHQRWQPTHWMPLPEPPNGK